MTKPVSLKDIYDVVNRLEDKVDKRLSSDEERIDELEKGQSKIFGWAGVISAIFGLVGGAVVDRVLRK